jgi:hypothetical protein
MSLDKEHQVVGDGIKSLLELIPILSNIERKIIENSTNLAYLSNLTFVCRKGKEILDQMDKRLGELETNAAKHASLTLAIAKMKNYQGEFCTISPNPSFYVAYPSSPDKEGYEEFVKQLGPNEVRPHYPTIGEKITAAMEAGGQVPWGLTGKINSTPKLRVTTKKDL